MKRIIFATILLAGASLALAKGYVDNKQTVTHDCAKDPEAAVMGNDNTITFTGACTSISVSGNGNKLTVATVKDVTVAGNHNTLDIDAPETISVSGNENSVWYRALDAKKPAVHDAGTKNKIRNLLQPVKVEKH